MSGGCPAHECHEEETLELLLVLCKYYDQAKVKLILDASVRTTVINIVQVFGQDILMRVFHLTRTWCSTLHCG